MSDIQDKMFAPKPATDQGNNHSVCGTILFFSVKLGWGKWLQARWQGKDQQSYCSDIFLVASVKTPEIWSKGLDCAFKHIYIYLIYNLSLDLICINGYVVTMPRVQLYVLFLRNWLCICAYR